MVKGKKKEKRKKPQLGIAAGNLKINHKTTSRDVSCLHMQRRFSAGGLPSTTVPAQQAGESDAGVFLGLNLVIPAAAQRRSTRPSWFPAYQNYPPSSPQQHAISWQFFLITYAHRAFYKIQCHLTGQSQGSASTHLARRRRLAEVQSEHQSGEERALK